MSPHVLVLGCEWGLLVRRPDQGRGTHRVLLPSSVPECASWRAHPARSVAMAAALSHSHGPSHGATEALSREAATASPVQTGERNRVAWVVPIPAEDSILKTSIIHKVRTLPATQQNSWISHEANMFVTVAVVVLVVR